MKQLLYNFNNVTPDYLFANKKKDIFKHRIKKKEENC